MRMGLLWKPIAKRSFLRVALLSAVLSSMGCFVLWDYSRVDRDFRQLKALLTDVRRQTAGQDKTLVARFTGKTVSITGLENGMVIKALTVPTLDQVNYNTTLGDDMIVFYLSGTGKYNKRIHGGDIRLKSWLGFRKNIVVRCTGLVMEGVYPNGKKRGASMEFWNQSWFWVGLFTLLSSVLVVFIKEWFTTRTKLKLEKFKAYTSDQFKAYNKLYEFIRLAYLYYPPSEPKAEFTMLMKGSPYDEIRTYSLYYQPDIRELLKKLESQYYCLGNLDCYDEDEFNSFIDNDFINILDEMASLIEKKVDEMTG